MSNSIALKRGIEKNLICNRLSQHVPIHWFKVNLFLNSFRLLEIVYSNGLLSRMETDTPAQLMRRKPRPFFHLEEKQRKRESTNANGKTAEERTDTESSMSVSLSLKKKQMTRFCRLL